jgi:hypothetical protein
MPATFLMQACELRRRENFLKYLLPQKTRRAQRKAFFWFFLILRIFASFAAEKYIFSAPLR